jgi:hypothetical protein
VIRLRRILTSIVIASIIVLDTTQIAWSQSVPLTVSSPAPAPTAHRTSAWLYVAGAAALTLLVAAYNAHCRQYPLACSGGGDDCASDDFTARNIANAIADTERKPAPGFGLSFVIR